MDKINNRIFTAVIASETIHIFCCVLPTVFSILSLLSGFGLVAAMPSYLASTHDMLHAYEVPMIIFSGIILLGGWAAYAYSRKINCRTEGMCSHKPCTPQKDKTKQFMILATCLFVMNITIYTVFHRDTHVAHDIVVQHDHAHGHQHNH